MTHLDDAIPSWEFRERHATHVAAEPARVFDAIRGVEARDIFLYGTLTALRRGFRGGRESILNVPKDARVIDVATRTGFRCVADDPPRELVIASNLTPEIRAAMNFLVEPDGRGGSHLSTETRVVTTAPRARRLFALYWFVIRAGSGFIRRMWLRAVKRRAEA